VGTVGLLGASVFPARLAIALFGRGSAIERIERLFAGTLIDLSAIAVVTSAVALVALVGPLVWSRLKNPWWQRLGPLVLVLPIGFLLWVLSVTAQEVKGERGAYPTMFDLAEGGGNLAFVSGSLDFITYRRVWVPATITLVLMAAVLVVVLRGRSRQVASFGPWAMGVVLGLSGAALGSIGAARILARDNRFAPATLGDPLTGLLESSFDMLLHRGPSTPRELVRSAELPPDLAATGAAILGWPPSAGRCTPHPYSRPLDPEQEPAGSEPRGRALLAALAKVSRALFKDDGPPLAVFQLSLEGFRADDLHALNPAAPAGIAPFINQMYESHQPGVVVGHSVYQAGVRTAHGLGAMLCGLGTLPYNLAIIRDLQPFAVRCASDVLADAGFRQSFFYGSDISFDEMDTFLRAHGYGRVISQAELPPSLPKGTWGGVSDLALFEVAVETVAKALEEERAPQLAHIMSLANHSPFPPADDMPARVTARVGEALKNSVNRADADDRKRLVAYAYTDAAVERLFEALEEKGIADRSIVVLAADHSTGHAFVWGSSDPETDAAKAQIPFAVIIHPSLWAKAADPAAIELAMAEVQALVDQGPLSQNDIPAMMLALLRASPSLRALPSASRWHTLGGQITSPYFRPGGDPASYLLGINGVSEAYALDRRGVRVGSYEDSVFLKTRVDRYRVTPRLIPVTAALIEVLNCSAEVPAARP
jgi:hypothetical protein